MNNPLSIMNGTTKILNGLDVNNNTNTNGHAAKDAVRQIHAPCSEQPDMLDWEWLRCQRETSIQYWASAGKRVGVAIIGLGRMGSIHLRNILREPRAKLLYAFDASETSVQAWSDCEIFKENQVRVMHASKFNLALEDEQVEAVIVATPTHMHEQQVHDALQSHKIVLVEKPLCMATDHIMPLFELADRMQTVLLTAMNRRYDPEFRHLRERAHDANCVGKIQFVRVTARDVQPPPLNYVKSSGGLFRDSAIHDIDLSLWIVRQLPTSVQVTGQTWQEHYDGQPEKLAELTQAEKSTLREIDDYFLALIALKFPDGTIATIDNSRQASYGYDQRCEVYGDKGMVRCDSRRALHATQLSGACAQGSAVQPGLNFSFASRFGTSYENELQDLLTLVQLSRQNTQSSANTAHLKLMEPCRPSLIAATQQIADVCSQAAKAGRSIAFDWSDDFKRQFHLDIHH